LKVFATAVREIPVFKEEIYTNLVLLAYRVNALVVKSYDMSIILALRFAF
jgi:hypothetical protein